MNISPAEPLRDVAAEFALEFDELFTMFFTVYSSHRAAICTYQFFMIEFLVCSIIHGLCTTFPASKVGLFALNALEVGIDGHCIFLILLIVAAFRVH